MASLAREETEKPVVQSSLSQTVLMDYSPRGKKQGIS